ncbi:MAG: hypothetical protein PHI78_03680 [Clostridia bacterium]|nr:hypothetical protein [Clostridia bacterium]
MKSCKKVIALIIAVIICCSCFFCAEKAEATTIPDWYYLNGYSCAYVEIIGVGSETITYFENDYTQIKINILQTYLKGFSGDLYVPSECVDFILSNNYALIFADNTDEGLICNDYDYDANSSRIIPLFPVMNNKIIIPENYYEVITYSDDLTSIKPCCQVLSYLEDYNLNLLENEKYLTFSDGMDVELLNDYFDLLPEKIEDNQYAFFLYVFACIGGLAFIFFKYYFMVLGLIIAVIFLIIYFISKKIKRKKYSNTPSETGENSKE